MSIASMIVVSILGLAIAGGNLAFWWWVARTGEERFRARVERHYRVVITRFRGHWRVNGPGSKGKHVLIELLQIAYFIGAMIVWSLAMIVALLSISLVDRIL